MTLLSRKPSPRLLLAGAALLLAAAPLWAQKPGSFPYIPPDARGYQRTLIYQNYYQNRVATVPSVTPPAPAPRRVTSNHVDVTVSGPVAAAPKYVTLRGPDGKLRRFELEGGPAAIRVRSFRVRPGETFSMTIVPNPARVNGASGSVSAARSAGPARPPVTE